VIHNQLPVIDCKYRGVNEGCASDISAVVFLYNVNDKFSNFLYIIQTGSGAHPASYPTGTWGSFPGREAVHSPTSGDCDDSCPTTSLLHSSVLVVIVN
jgi:hypothetical protein